MLHEWFSAWYPPTGQVRHPQFLRLSCNTPPLKSSAPNLEFAEQLSFWLVSTNKTSLPPSNFQPSFSILCRLLCNTRVTEKLTLYTQLNYIGTTVQILTATTRTLHTFGTYWCTVTNSKFVNKPVHNCPLLYVQVQPVPCSAYHVHIKQQPWSLFWQLNSLTSILSNLTRILYRRCHKFRYVT